MATLMLICKLMMAMILCCHWFGCLWWLVSDLERSEERDEGNLMAAWYAPDNSWIVPMWLAKSDDFGLKYSHAFLWGAGMVTAMVPRDIEAVTTLEAYITTIAMFIGLMLNAYVISSLTTALTSMNSKKQITGKKIETVHRLPSRTSPH